MGVVVVPKRIILSAEDRAKIAQQITGHSRQLRKWPYPRRPKVPDIDLIIADLERIVSLNKRGEQYIPAKLLDRAIKWLHHAEVIRWRLTA
jgi:hypothetical protein